MPLDHDTLRLIRLSKRLSQEEVAERAQIALSTYNAIERGERASKAQIGTVDRICEALEVGLDDVWMYPWKEAT